MGSSSWAHEDMNNIIPANIHIKAIGFLNSILSNSAEYIIP